MQKWLNWFWLISEDTGYTGLTYWVYSQHHKLESSQWAAHNVLWISLVIFSSMKETYSIGNANTVFIFTVSRSELFLRSGQFALSVTVFCWRLITDKFNSSEYMADYAVSILVLDTCVLEHILEWLQCFPLPFPFFVHTPFLIQIEICFIGLNGFSHSLSLFWGQLYRTEGRAIYLQWSSILALLLTGWCMPYPWQPCTGDVFPL